MICCKGYVMGTVVSKPVFKTLLLATTGMLAAAAAHAGGPQVTFYLTVPLFGPANGQVFGLRLDRGQALPDMRNFNPASPLNRRALLDLQMGAHSALRLELDRRLTWDIDKQEWHSSSREATFTLRFPTHAAHSTAVEQSAWMASLANPFREQGWKPLVKSHAVEP
jgi:hypothetical protein